jgi:integrase/recombinase XerD
MLALMFPRTHIQYRALPLIGSVLEDLCSWLHARGFPPHVIRRRLLKAAFLDQCLRERGVRSLAAYTPSDLRAKLPCGNGRARQIAHALGECLVQYLVDDGALAVATPTRSTSLIAAYREHLVRVRGLAPGTVRGYVRSAHQFLRFVRYDADAGSLRALQVRDIDAFLTDAGRHVTRVTMQQVTAAVRTLLRFLAAHGHTAGHLAASVESVRQYRGERLPRALPWTTVLTLLRGIDRSTVTGLRDYAMALLIATYGLRASEVAGLRLDDIHWRGRVMLVPRPKVGTPLALPLTDEVATALLDYVRVRHASPEERQIFLRVLPPAGPIKRSAVLASFHLQAQRVGLKVPARFGPHCFRHSLAMHLLRQGTPLKTIADLLGHRSVESTTMYLRLDVDDLRDVALPLPKDAGRS